MSSSSSSSDQSDVDEEPENSITPAQTQMPPLSIAVENSSDIKVGPHLQYNGPVTIKQYITVHSVENLDEISNVGPLQSASAFFRKQNGLSPGRMDFMEPNISSQKKTTNTAQDQKDTKKGNPFSWKWMTSHFSRLQLISATLVLSLSIIIIIAVLIIYVGPDNSSQLELIGSSGTLRVPAGIDAQWEVQSKAPHPVVFEWTDPKGNKLKRTQLAKYRLVDNGYRSVVRLYDVTHDHAGIYVLRAYNETEKFEQIITINLIIYDAKTPAHGKVVACYVASWANVRQGAGAFFVSSIDPTLCTHLIYAFAVLDSNNTIQSWRPEYDLEDEDNSNGAYKEITALKEKYPSLKVMLAIGGWDEGGLKYSKMARSPSKRMTFITSVSKFLRKYGFDGLDLHWQYPVISWRNGGQAQHQDKVNLVILLKELREVFEKYGLLLTMPLGMTKDILKDSYNVREISKHVHYVFALCHAYHTHFEDKTGPNAPLYHSDLEDTNNVAYGISYLLKNGVAPEKLILGIPLYGRLFLIRDDYQGDIHYGVPTKEGVSLRSYYTGEDGTMAYYEVCRAVKQSDWKVELDFDTQTPYAYNKEKHQFLSFDDSNSVAQKVKLAIENDLGGIVLWSIDQDDFGGSCLNTGPTTFPLTRAVNRAIVEALREKEETDVITKLSNKTSTAMEVTNSPNETAVTQVT